VVDVGEQAQLAWRQGVLGREVALVARALAEMAEHEGQRVLIGFGEFADRDDGHLRRVTPLTPHT
jgi:hypothetical protein